jgi:hypothetical protein
MVRASPQSRRPRASRSGARFVAVAVAVNDHVNVNVNVNVNVGLSLPGSG